VSHPGNAVLKREDNVGIVVNDENTCAHQMILLFGESL
jgi:hypothetical protein